jgi:murein DD-endopeptidase MepM/ murein hydrolase activator NlpD
VKITVLLVGGPNRSTRTLSVPKWLVVGLGVWLTLSLTFGVVLYVSFARGRHLDRLNDSLKSQIRSQERIISTKEADLDDRQRRIDELSDRFDRIKSKLDEINEFDIRIRQYLGLDTSDFSPPRDSHQGGMPPTTTMPTGTDHCGPTWYVPYAGRETDGLYRYACLIDDRTEEVLDFLHNQQSRFKRLPSILPVRGEGLWYSSGFGWRKDPFTGQRAFHNGLDVAGALNDEVIAPADGKVVSVRSDRFMGKMVKLDHGSGIETLFGHLNKFNVKKGDRVKRGQVIAYMGNTGRSTGTHLHYSVLENNRYKNPTGYIWDYTFRNRSLAPMHLHVGGGR